MRTKGQGDRAQSRVAPIHLLAAAAILGLLIMPVAFAEDANPGATKSAKVTKQIKKLKRRLAALEARPDQVGQVPASLPPSGPAGGDLTGSFPSPLIGPDAVGGAEIASNAILGSHVAPDALSGFDINEPAVPIPTAWAVVSDPDGNSQPDGDPRALASEGVLNINDGDGGPIAPSSGRHCYELGFTPDLIQATVDDQTTVPNPDINVYAHKPAGGVCGPSADDAYLTFRIAGGGQDDSDVHISFYDLE